MFFRMRHSKDKQKAVTNTTNIQNIFWIFVVLFVIMQLTETDMAMYIKKLSLMFTEFFSMMIKEIV